MIDHAQRVAPFQVEDVMKKLFRPITSATSRALDCCRMFPRTLAKAVAVPFKQTRSDVPSKRRWRSERSCLSNSHWPYRRFLQSIRAELRCDGMRPICVSNLALGPTGFALMPGSTAALYLVLRYTW